MCLFWVPFNGALTQWLPREKVIVHDHIFMMLASNAAVINSCHNDSSTHMIVMTRAQWIGGSHWLWGIVMFTLTYEMLHQLTALPLGDGGIWPENFAPALKDWYHSRTMGQFRFVKARDAAPRNSAEMRRRDTAPRCSAEIGARSARDFDLA